MSRMKTPSAGIHFLYGKYQNKNDKNENAYLKWYGRAVILSTLDTDDVAQHMMEHGCVYGTDVIKGVLEKFYDCAVELLFQNRRVKMNGLGTLCMGLVTKGAESESDFTAKNIEKARIYLLPDSTTDQQLSGAKLRARMNFSGKATSSFVNLDNFEGGSGGSGGGGLTPVEPEEP